MKMKSWHMTAVVAVSLVLASCGGGTSTTTNTYAIGGTVSGLTGTGLLLQDNGADNLSVTSNGTFTFATALAAAATYNVTVLTQPTSPAQTCTVTVGSGTVVGIVTSVEVNCTLNSFMIGGNVSGLSGTNLVLQDNGGNNTPISGNGSFTFSTAITRGNTYNVTVLTQPSGPAQTCGVTNGFGTANANVTGVQVNCVSTTTTYKIGGMVSGLAGTGLVLENNGGDNLSVSVNGSFTFAIPIASGTNYSVTVLTQPTNPAQTCAATSGNGTADANVTAVQVTCTTN